MGIRDKPIAPASPWQNGFAERLIGSIRRECLDHIIVLGEVHQNRVELPIPLNCVDLALVNELDRIQFVDVCTT
jgi:hypothetical protein